MHSRFYDLLNYMIETKNKIKNKTNIDWIYEIIN